MLEAGQCFGVVVAEGPVPPCLLSLYARALARPPTPSELLLCGDRTTAAELELFLRCWTHGAMFSGPDMGREKRMRDTCEKFGICLVGELLEPTSPAACYGCIAEGIPWSRV